MDPVNARSRRGTVVRVGSVLLLVLGAHCRRAPTSQQPSPEQQYILRARTAEAMLNVNRIARGMSTYAQTERFDRGSSALAVQRFPESAPMTPATVPGRTPVESPPGTFAHPTWTAIDFSLSDPHYYSYEVHSDGTSFTARAIGDLDGDGVTSTFERAGRLANGEVVLDEPRRVRELE